MFGRKSKEIPYSGGSVSGSITIAWETQFKQDNVMWKVPRLIRLNDNIVVREDEIAVFYRDGKVLTYFDRPDRYALTDFNAPVVGPLLKFFTGVQQQAEVYYLQKRFFDSKFGSTEPYEFTDPLFGVVSLRVFGEYRWRVSDPANFINRFVGTFNEETMEQVESRLREQMVLLVYSAIGKMKDSGIKVTDLASNLQNIEQVVLATSADHFQQYGVEINKVPGLTISLPDSVQKAVDTRSEMSVLGVNYMQYQAGQAMVDAAKNPSGVAGVGAGLGVGIGAGAGMGYAMGGQMMGAVQPSRQCPKCGAIITAQTNFCPNCGAPLQQPQPAQQMLKCPKCGSDVPSTSRFCPNCGTELKTSPLKCQNCGFEVQTKTKFCPNCGKPL
ncbi:MAG: SPFH domain-containing protein [Thermoplasmata archaeon]|uniref:SPFH domain-containing protein n=1 Tax=Candidatus Sysuiplasma superficiale TaxID=2823368 RepID=A0A8J7YTT7_9ARCH|nr:SPFH domain-containing protein [Candidatus Sysuiplasma superficiale]MBX8644377.1 SPFH domain-containing protein [Candidatus Sysuiplasma superficiale]MCL4346638.1 SPFH domain-containing protein [Candidatus Thermoplasmatota archaeon]